MHDNAPSYSVKETNEYLNKIVFKVTVFFFVRP